MDAFRLITLLVACTIPSFGCVKRYDNPNPAQRGTALVWVSDDPAVLPGDVLMACLAWAPVGVACQLTRDKQHADIRVSVTHMDPMENARHSVESRNDGSYSGHAAFKPGCDTGVPKNDEPITVAQCSAGLTHMESGNIEILPECIAAVRGANAGDVLLHVLMHEIGHALGLNHVPERCHDSCIEYLHDENGEDICGPSVMNSPGSDLQFITDADAKTFLLHRWEHAPPAMHPVRDPINNARHPL